VSKEKILILGGRRGLGNEILKYWKFLRPEDQLWSSSRKPFEEAGIATFVCDLSRAVDVEKLLDQIDVLRPQRIFYVPGGGPYGDFASKDWKDHEWALKVTLLTPMRLIHAALKKEFLQQFVCIGSAIAESQADPGAASYAAAKHGLLGLIGSLQPETNKDIRLFSPGYMKTDMLPMAVRDRLVFKDIEEPKKVAKDFVDWVQNPQASWHWESRPS
jgi:short-subunit dehydrogenase